MRLRLCIFFFGLIALTGCSIMEDPDGACPDETTSSAINFTFNLFAPSTIGGRVDDNGHDEVDSENPAFENLIYTNDFAFYVFAELPGEDNSTQQPLLTYFDSSHPSSDPFTNIHLSGDHYIVTVGIPKEKFDNLVPEELNRVAFRVVAIANSNNVFKNYTPGDNTTLNDFISIADDWIFGMSNIYSGTGSSEGMKANARIPMFGSSVVTYTREQLKASDEINPASGGNISMLRALAKINVIDHLSTTGFPHISKVTFQGQTNRAHILPYDAAHYQNNHQVEIPNIAPGTQTELVMTKVNNIWSMYIPEQTISDQNTDRPSLHIEVILNENPTTDDIKLYTVPLHGYNDQEFNFGNAILRNHIYTLSVDGIGAATDAVITANIIPWDTISFELNYTDIVNHEPVVWDSDSYESINKNTIYLTPWGQNIDGQPELVPLKGRKKITLPTGATWTAFLLNNGDDSSAIGFVDQTGIPSLKQISGDYQDTEIVFNIGSNQVDPGDNRNSAILQLVVVLPNGNVYEVPLSSEYATYTIVQNPQ